MKRIEIRGMLVDASYDDPFLHREIENGVFTPSSKVIREIDEADGDDIAIHIDSEGGDVFAFHAVLDKVLNYPGNITFKIGACAFSEAANFVLLSKRPVQCYPFSIVLFHSAMSTVYDGASSELRSEATILDKINAPVKAALKAYGIPEEQVEDGFRDRNALVLGADELVKYGIATLLDDEAPSIPKVDEATSKRLAALAEANQRIAAMYRAIASVNKDTKMKKAEDTILPEEEKKAPVPAPESEEKKEEGTPCADEQTEEEKPVEEQTEEEKPVEEQEQTEEEKKPEEEKPEEEKPEADDSDDGDKLLETLETLRDNLEALTARVGELEETLTEKEVELQDAKKALKAERSKRIGAMAAAVSGKTESSGPSDWPAAVKACKGDKLEAYKQYPELAKAWTKTN